MEPHMEHDNALGGEQAVQQPDARSWLTAVEPIEGTGQLLLTVPEAAAVLRMSRAKLYALMRRGQVLSVLIGGSRRVPRTALLAYIGELTEVAEREQVERRQADRRQAGDWRGSWSRFGLDRPA